MGKGRDNVLTFQRPWFAVLAASSAGTRVEQRSKGRVQLERQGLKAVDALHVACAEAAESEYFLTCDDRLVRRYQGDKLRVLNKGVFAAA